MLKRGRGSAGSTVQTTPGLRISTSYQWRGSRLNRIPSACVGDMVMATVTKASQIWGRCCRRWSVRQGKQWRRKYSVFKYFGDNAGVIVNPQWRDEGTWACSCRSKNGEQMGEREKEIGGKNGTKFINKRDWCFCFPSYFNIREKRRECHLSGCG